MGSTGRCERVCVRTTRAFFCARAGQGIVSETSGAARQAIPRLLRYAAGVAQRRERQRPERSVARGSVSPWRGTRRAADAASSPFPTARHARDAPRGGILPPRSLKINGQPRPKQPVPARPPSHSRRGGQHFNVPAAGRVRQITPSAAGSGYFDDRLVGVGVCPSPITTRALSNDAQMRPAPAPRAAGCEPSHHTRGSSRCNGKTRFSGP